MSEEWRIVVGDGDYEISSHGRVRRVTGGPGARAGHVLRCRTSAGSPYPTVSLHGVKTARVHVLVLEAFVGPRPTGQEARHLDGDHRNNRVENLVWGTSSQNKEDNRRLGRLRGGNQRGEDVGTARLTELDVLAIRASPETQEALARRYGVNQTNISRIKRRVSWRHIA